jgi:hypothetical protein
MEGSGWVKEHYYFCRMKRLVLICFFFFSILIQGLAQIRLNTLLIGHNEVYELQGSDIIVVDTLILRDSARLILNSSKKDNFIHARKMIVGKGGLIDGKGKHGDPGKMGVNGETPNGPCKDATDGQLGTPGTAGNVGVNLFLYVKELQINGRLIIDLAGGDGGDGGKGGTGGDGNPGTRLCQGGNGGNGGNGGAGGNGGNAGRLMISSGYGSDLRSLMGEKIIIRLYGGFAGLGGEGGTRGEPGLSSSKDGDHGKKGLPGPAGLPGKPGAVLFERK